LIKVLVISESVLQTFNALRQSIQLDLQPFWQHSLHVAVLARELAKRLNTPLTEEAYLSGLLHDVGRLALAVAAQNDLGDLFDAPDDDTLCAREQGRVGMSHLQAGVWLLTQWHLNTALIDSVNLHHDTAQPAPDPKPLTWLLQMAHQMVDMPLTDRAQLAKLADKQGQRADDLQAIAQTAALQVEQIAKDLGLSINADSAPQHKANTTPSPRLDGHQEQLARDVFDRSVFNEMAMTLVGKHNMHAALTSMREHASALLHLEDSVILLLRDVPRMLVATSVGEGHRQHDALSFGVATHAPMAACVENRAVIFTTLDDEHANALHQFMDAQELVLIPLVTSDKVLGVLMAVVPVLLSTHLKNQRSMLQAFGVYAGLVLARRHQADKLRRAQMAVVRQEGRMELLRISHAVRQLIDTSAGKRTMAAVDLCATVRDMLQVLQDSQLVPEQTQVSSHFPDRRTMVRGSVEMIKQIVHILVKHGCEAMPDGGEITVAVGALVQRQGAVYTQLSVSSTALAPAVQAVKAQLYEPVFGRQVDEKHMQDLGIVNHLAEQMAGVVKLTTNDFGTRFDVLLPCAPQTAAPF